MSSALIPVVNLCIQCATYTKVYHRYGRFFAQKFMILLQWNRLFLDMLYVLYCYIVKHLLPVVKIQNGAQFQDGRQNYFIV
jgi:hypothetical protein